MKTVNKKNGHKNIHRFSNIYQNNHRQTYTALKEKIKLGVLDIQLDNEIEQTEQHLAMLFRQKELRNQEYCWDDVYNIIQEEINLGNVSHLDECNIKNHRFEQEKYSKYHNHMPEGDLNS